MLSQATFILALAASASAHMIMAEPFPFGRATLTSFPLKPADFPCKQRSGAYDIDLGMNQWNAGETKSVKFNGTAAHGGGSCQFSITTDSEPTKESQWKVIHSVEGNCLTTLDKNFPDVAGDPLMVRNATDIPVTMPSSIPDGQYTFAWTWLNRVGNREFYMNCAPIQVGSGSGAASTASAAQALSVLPDMFVANLPDTECTTTEGQDFVYPDAGQSVSKGSVGVNFGSTLGGAACAVQNKLGVGAGKIGSPSAGTPSTPSQGTPSQSSTPSKPSEKPVPSPAAPVKGDPQQSKIPTSPGGGVFAPGASPAPPASSAPVAVPSAQPSPPAAKPSPPAAKPVPATPPQTGGDNNTTPVNSECTPCTNDGAVVCMGTKQFGLCNRGCAVAQDLAAGMVCMNGAVVGAASKNKRHAFPRAHLHRHFTAARLI